MTGGREAMKEMEEQIEEWTLVEFQSQQDVPEHPVGGVHRVQCYRESGICAQSIGGHQCPLGEWLLESVEQFKGYMTITGKNVWIPIQEGLQSCKPVESLFLTLLLTQFKSKFTNFSN
jgi:hypothetical protein